MFTGSGSVKGAAQGAMSKQVMPMQPMSRQMSRAAVPMQTQMPTRSITPGYEEAARNYESAFNSGDYNSPYIIGQDPKNFGYAEDVGQYSDQPSIYATSGGRKIQIPAKAMIRDGQPGGYSRRPSNQLLDSFKLRR